MDIRINVLKNNRNGASLLEVMIAMIILTIGFLGVMALAVSLTNNNAIAGKINTATTIAQSEVSQLNCLGVSGIENSPVLKVPGTYTYTVSPTVLNPDTRNAVTTPSIPTPPVCINPVLAVGGQAPVNIGVTLPYTVTINLSNNPNQPSTTTVINAQVEVSWQDMGQHVIVMNDIIS